MRKQNGGDPNHGRCPECRVDVEGVLHVLPRCITNLKSVDAEKAKSNESFEALGITGKDSLQGRPSKEDRCLVHRRSCSAGVKWH